MVVWKCNLIMLWMSQLLVMAGYDAMNPFVSLFMKEGLGITETATLAFFVSAFTVGSLIGYGLSNPLWGYLGDRYGMKVMLLRGTFLTSFFWPMMAYVKSPWTLVTLRLVTSVLAGTTAGSQMMLARTAPVERQGFAQGMLSTAIWGGSMLGNVIGGLVIHYFSYKYAFWMCGCMYFLAGIFILFTEDKGSRAVSEPQKGGRKSTHWWQLGTAIWILIGLFFLLGLIQKIELPYVALRVGQLVSQESAAYWTGIVSAFVALGAILSGIVFGWVIDRYPARKLILPLLGGAAAVMFLQGLVPSLKVFATSRTLGYFIAGAILPLLQKRLTQSISSSKRGLSFGLSNTAFSIGGILASILGGLLMANFDVQGVFIGTAVAMLVAAPFFFWGIRATGK